jgi:arylsulfatase A-like enzyme
MGDVQVADWVIEQLGRKQSGPFFLACGIYRPHRPWYVPRKYFDRFDLADIQLPPTRDDDLQDVPAAGIKMARPDRDHARVLKYQQWPQAVRGYLASIAFADTQVGRVLDALDASRYAQNTIIVFWTDHGWHLGEKHHWRKFTLWEEATRTPMVIVAPGVKPGSRCAQTVNLLDIYPTLIDLCGLAPRAELEGVSLRPLLADAGAPWDRPSLTTHGRNNHAVRSRRYRYIRYSDGAEELYDHTVDPQEWHNLAGDPNLKTVKTRLAAWLPKRNAPDLEPSQ